MRERKITPIHYGTLIRIFELDGFTVKRKKGPHYNDKGWDKETPCHKKQSKVCSCDPYSYKYDNRWDVERALL